MKLAYLHPAVVIPIQLCEHGLVPLHAVGGHEGEAAHGRCRLLRGGHGNRGGSLRQQELVEFEVKPYSYSTALDHGQVRWLSAWLSIGIAGRWHGVSRVLPPAQLAVARPI